MTAPPVDSTIPTKRLRAGHAVAGAAVFAALALLVLPPPETVPESLWRGSAAVVLAVGLWATAVIPDFLTAALFFLICVALGLAPQSVVFSGFAASATWLVFAGLVLGHAVQRTGLGARAVRLALARYRGGFVALIAALVLVGMAVSYFIPSSMGRVILLAPVAATLADRLGFVGDDSRGRAGLMLAATLGAILPAFSVLPANVPNVVMAAAAESLYDIGFSYGEYWLLNVPVLGLGSALLIVALVCLLFRDRPTVPEPELVPDGLSGDERLLAGVLLGTIVLWGTDFAHGVHAAWVALAAALFCLMPRVGMVPATALGRDVNLGPWLFVAGVVGMGAVAAEIGLADFVGGRVASLVPAGGAEAYAAIVAIGMAVALFTCHPAAPAVMTPLAADLAEASGWPLKSVLLAQVPTWTVFPFAYQVPPILVALAIGGIRLGRALPLLLLYWLLGTALILPLHYLWGQWLGVFP